VYIYFCLDVIFNRKLAQEAEDTEFV